ncbi:hypothetical protein [Phocaeicola sp.]
MHDMVKILERELENTGLIFIYKEETDNKWYAYEQSAFFLNQMIKDNLSLERFVMEGALWLARAEVDIDHLPKEHVISYSKGEYVLRYKPETKFHEWLSDIG